jgi:uncharacterized protein YbdZ (MbtH family)
MSMLTVSVEEGLWGTWLEPVMAPNGYHVTGLRVRYEDPQGSHADDTALNGLKMECTHFPGLSNSPAQSPGGGANSVQVLTVAEGNWGSWKPVVRIPHGYYIVAISVRFEGNQGSEGDDTCMNGIRLKCRHYHGADIQVVSVWEGNWGVWKPDVLVPEGYYIVGFQCRVEKPQGANQDDTAMNGIRMLLKPA